MQPADYCPLAGGAVMGDGAAEAIGGCLVLEGDTATTGGCYLTGSPLHRDYRKSGKRTPCQGKRREFGNFAPKKSGICMLKLKFL